MTHKLEPQNATDNLPLRLASNLPKLINFLIYLRNLNVAFVACSRAKFSMHVTEEKAVVAFFDTSKNTLPMG